MTVEQLLDHFDFFPDKIVYFDEPNNTQDTVYVMRITANGEKEYDDDRYNNFVDEYGKREIEDWHYRGFNVLDLELR